MKLSNRRRGGLRIGNPYAHRARSSSQTSNLLVNKTTITGSFVFIVAFFAAFFSSSVLAPIQSSDASDLVTATLDSSGYYVKINSTDVAMGLTTTPAGAMTVVNSTVKTATNSPSGYKLFLSTSPQYPSGQEKSPSDKLKNGLYLDGELSRTDGAVIAAASGTGGTSGTLAPLTDNTWGYAVDKNTTGTPTIWTTEDHSTMESSTPTNDKFAAVPPVGSEELIQATSTPNVSYDTPESSIDFTDPSTYTEATLYYGIRGNISKPSGAYSNTIAYTAVAQAAPDPGYITFTPAVYTRSSTYESMTWNDRVSIQTTLYTNMEDLGTATVTLSGGPEGEEDLVCTNPVLTSVNNLLNITCTLPQAYAGKYKVAVHLDKFGQDYTGEYTYAATWDTVSAMQEMTTDICAEPQTPNTNASTSSTTLPAAQFNGTQVPEKFLTDLRGGGGHINPTTGEYQEAYTGKYRIRKLADGNCWMTENMDLPQGESTTFYSYNTNLTADPNDSTIDQDSYSVATDGTISWTPTNIVNTSTCTTGAADCSPNTINTTGHIDTNNKNAHSYNGNGSQGTRTIDTKACDKSTNTKCPVNWPTTETQSIGTYYNYAAAVAQSDPYSDSDAANSICPYGWRLPYASGSGTNKSFYKLLFDTYGLADNDSYSSTAAQSFPLSFVFSGYYSWNTGYGNIYNQGSSSGWWPSLSNGSTNSYYLVMHSSRLVPQGISNKLSGFSVHCVQN